MTRTVYIVTLKYIIIPGIRYNKRDYLRMISSRGSGKSENSCVIGKRRSREIPFRILYLTPRLCPPTPRAVYWRGFRGWFRAGVDGGKSNAVTLCPSAKSTTLYNILTQTLSFSYNIKLQASTVAVTSVRYPRAGPFQKLHECNFFFFFFWGEPIDLCSPTFETCSALMISATLLLVRGDAAVGQ